MSKKKAKKKGKISAPVVAGILLIGAIGSIGGDDTANTNNADKDEPDYSIVETVSDEKENQESIVTENKSTDLKEITSDQKEESTQPPATEYIAPTVESTQSQEPENIENPVAKEEPALPTVEEPAPTPEPQQPEPEPAIDPEKAFRESLYQYNYVGSSESDKYHKPSCRWTSKINDSNLVHFDTESEAVSAGYSSCGTCNP